MFKKVVEFRVNIPDFKKNDQVVLINKIIHLNG